VGVIEKQRAYIRILVKMRAGYHPVCRKSYRLS